ncbi:MAG TPA: DNA recombination protein RmuC, partial [Vicinamibacteria bacterium]|nr:DNA recombination protein RmuC [Vicinamibacteria bacterium]
MEWLAIGLLAFALGAGIIVFLAQRGGAQESLLGSLQAPLGQLQGEILRLSRGQEELRRDLQRSREASVVQLSQAVDGIRGDLNRAQLSLAEVKALEEGRARQMDQAATSLRRLEAVVAGSQSRGEAGENILARSLAQLPADLLEMNVPFGSKIVEYALHLPGGRLLPIDSKWTSVASLERLALTDDPQEQKKLVEQVARDVRARIREMVKYLDPERTLSIALLAVPDAVYAAAPEAHGEGYRDGVLVVPYSLALPYVLSLYRLALRFGTALDADQLSAHLRGLEELLRRIEEDVEGRLSRGL